MIVFSGVGLIAALRGSMLHNGERRAWKFVAAGFSLLLATLVLFLIPGSKTTFPAPADATRLGLVLMLIVAAHSFRLRVATPLERRTSAFDALTVVAGVSMALWYLVVGPVLARRGAIAAAAAMYAVADLVLLFGFVRVLLRGADDTNRRPVALLASATVFLMTSDAFLEYHQAHGSNDHRTSVVQLACIMTVSFLLAAAAVERCRDVGRTTSSAPQARPVASKIPYLAVAGGWTLMIIAASNEELFPWTGLVSGGLAITGLVVLRQVTVQQASEAAAATDGLTGLANRSHFHEKLTRGLKLGAHRRRGTAVLLIDMNGFKRVNDTLGHKAGDRLLAAFSAILRSSLVGSDVAGRLGGDEFAAVLHDIDTLEEAEVVVRRLAAATAEPVPIDGIWVRASASVGIALSGPGELTSDEILHRADAAMYSAKRGSGDTRWRCWDATLDIPDDSSLEEELSRAVSFGQLHLVYQPIVDLAGGELHGAEVQVRWHHSRRGLLEQDVIIPLAESTGMIGALGRWVLKAAAENGLKWRLPLHIHISPLQLEDEGFSADVLAAGQDPGYLVLQLAESARTTASVPMAHLALLRSAGVHVALRDFGTGRASLHHLSQLSVDILKLDRRFVASLDGSVKGNALAAAVIRLGHDLGLATVAEGVETQLQAEELLKLGCTMAQGYPFHRAVSSDQLEALIEGGAVRI